MDKQLVFLFSGQGSHYYHMGGEFYENLPVFKNCIMYLDGIARRIIGESVISKIYDTYNKRGTGFARTLYSHPAIFMVEYSLAHTLIEAGVIPQYVLGTSLGEFTAAAVSGVLTPEEALCCVIKQAQFLEAFCDNGAMIAVLHNPALYEQIPMFYKKSELVSINYDEHFVISASKTNLNEIEEYMVANSITYHVLDVSFAFHSEGINKAEMYYTQFLKEKDFDRPRIPYMSCVCGGFIDVFPKDYFWQVVRKPILLRQAIDNLEKGEAKVYVDVSPGSTLAGFVKRNIGVERMSEVFPIMTPFLTDIKNLNIVLGHFSKKYVKKERQGEKMLAYVFPGQGSQHKGMGGELFEEFQDLTLKADKILGYSIKELCLEDREGKLGETQYTQPALYIVNALTYYKKIKDMGRTPDFVAGHSLGEYNALLAAGVFDFETGLRIVKYRGELMSKASGGGMAAVIGISLDKIKQILEENAFKTIDIANINTPSQIVISGPKEDIEMVQSAFQAAGAKNYVILKVSGAFHSRYMESAKMQFNEFINQFEFSIPSIPVISNITARPYKKSEIKTNMSEQITSSVMWTDSIRYLMGKDNVEIVQVGPGTAITGLVRSIQREAEPLIVDDNEHDEELVCTNDNVSLYNLETAAVEEEKRYGHENCDIVSGSTIGNYYNEKLNSISYSAVSQEAVCNIDRQKSLHEPTQLNNSIKQTEQPETQNNKKGVGECCTPSAYIGVKEENVKESSGMKNIVGLTAQALGCEEFKKDYNLKYAYLTGGMYRGIASKEMVVRVGKMGMMGFFGTGGLSSDEIREAISYIQRNLADGEAYGMNIIYNIANPQVEEDMVDIMLKFGIKNVEASAYMNITSAIARYKIKGLRKDKNGTVISTNRIIAKISRPEVAEIFMSPVNERTIESMLAERKITAEEAELAKQVPIADDICVEADSGGHTDQGVAYALMPAIIKLRDDMMKRYGYSKKIRVGAAGGIGTPEAAAAAFVLGADFILTGSINQCTVEAATSNSVKDLLQKMNVQDTEYAPAGDMFEMGAKVQVLKKGLFFPSRAKKLYDLYRLYDSLEEIDDKTKKQIEENYFKKSFSEVYSEVKEFLPAHEIERIESSPKYKMASIFRWYFGYSSKLAISGSEEKRVDYQVHCGPALGAFNQWVKGTSLENWRNRHVDEIGLMLMNETADLLERRFKKMFSINR
ncbi:MAG: ACP S-malonyltransferase [Clostridia bacterium]|nr:ACP S-malonyltransferase [Clostridia bacterium]